MVTCQEGSQSASQTAQTQPFTGFCLLTDITSWPQGHALLLCCCQCLDLTNISTQEWSHHVPWKTFTLLSLYTHLNTGPVGQWERISLLLYIFLGLLVFYWISLLMWLFLHSNGSRIILAIAMSVHYCDPVSHSFSLVPYKVKKSKYR